MGFNLEPIGHVQGGRSGRKDDHWAMVEAEILLDPTQLDKDATLGLTDFSHITVTFLFDQLSADQLERGARHPRNNLHWPKVGILAQRGSKRPNRLGVTTCEVLAAKDHLIRVRGLDAIDGTPVLDIKPHMRAFAPRSDVREPDWVADIMAHYWD